MEMVAQSLALPACNPRVCVRVCVRAGVCVRVFMCGQCAILQAFPCAVHQIAKEKRIVTKSQLTK